MPSKKSIYLSNATLAVIGPVGPRGLSGRIEAIVARYADILHDNPIDASFSLLELYRILEQVDSGVDFGPYPALPYSLLGKMNAATAGSGDELQYKLRHRTRAQFLALIEHVEQSKRIPS